jgi:hypothetical protein
VDGRDKPGHDGLVLNTSFQLRPYCAEDEDAAIALWLETWQQAYPSIDFAARVPWWRERWRNALVPNAAIIIAEQAGALAGFVTIDATGYLDQLVVAPGDRSSPTCWSTRRSDYRPGASCCWSIMITPVPSASISATALPMPARTSIRPRAGRC